MAVTITKNILIRATLELEYGKPLDQSLITDELLKLFVVGYRDAINSKLDAHNYCRITSIEYFEEYMYMEGFRIGSLDYVLGVCKEANIKFDEDYLNIIKIGLCVTDFGDSLITLSEYLAQI